MDQIVLETEGLSKSYKQTQALDNVSIKLNQ